jgi:hypothetical protein
VCSNTMVVIGCRGQEPRSRSWRAGAGVLEARERVGGRVLNHDIGEGKVV